MLAQSMPLAKCREFGLDPNKLAEPESQLVTLRYIHTESRSSKEKVDGRNGIDCYQSMPPLAKGHTFWRIRD